MDKAELIRHEIEKRRDHNLAIGNPLFAAMAEEDIELLSFIDSMQEEPVSDDFKKFEEEYFEKEKDDIVCIYDRIAGLVDGAQWQKQHMMNDAVMATKTIEIFGKRLGVVEDTPGDPCNSCALQEFCDKVNEMIEHTGTDWGYPTICQVESGRDHHFVYLPNN